MSVLWPCRQGVCMLRLVISAVVVITLSVSIALGRAWAATDAESPIFNLQSPIFSLQSQVSDSQSLILLNAGSIDTDSPAAKTLRQPAGAFQGKRLWLVQFGDVIQPDWYSALEKTGVQVIT